MSKINGIGIGVSYGNSSGTGGLLNSSTFFAPLKTSLILQRGTGGPTWSRATKAWGFNELGYLEELASGCAFFGGARLVRNIVSSTEDVSAAGWTKANVTTPSANTVVCSAGTTLQQIYGGNKNYVVGEKYLIKARLSYIDHPYVQIHISSGGSTAGANFDIQNGTYQTIAGASASISLVSPGVYDCSVWITATITATFVVSPKINFVSGLGAVLNASFAGDGIKSFGITRIQMNDVTNYDASYIPEYVSVGVVASPFFGAGIDGAKYFETDWQGAPIAAANLLGFRREVAATNNLLHSRDLSNAAWSTKTNVTAAKTATGLDGIANTATTLTSTAADAIILQPITLASAARCASAYVKRRTGTGTISLTQDGGSTWTDITSLINGSTWSRVQITSTLANPSVGFKIGTSGDAIDVDCVQNEAGAVATSPIVTTTAAVTRNADSLTYQTAGNIDLATGTMFCELFSPAMSAFPPVFLLGTGSCSLVTDEPTSWRFNDSTTTVTIASGLSSIKTGKRKRAASWGGATKSVCGDGIAPTSGAFDGSFGTGATIDIGNTLNGYIGPVAIYNYKMTDAELQAITS